MKRSLRKDTPGSGLRSGILGAVLRRLVVCNVFEVFHDDRIALVHGARSRALLGIAGWRNDEFLK